MAATSAVQGDQPSASGTGGAQNNNLPLKGDGTQENAKGTALTEKQSTAAVDSSKPVKEKSMKDEQASQKFVDAPLPTTNAWVKRSANLGGDTKQAQPPVDTKKEVTAQEKGPVQGNSTQQRSGKGAKGAAVAVDKSKAAEKPKAEKSKVDSNGGKQTPSENSHKPKIKKFGEDYVEAPPPAVNPWKKPTSAAVVAPVAVPFSVEQDPTPAAAVISSGSHRNKEVRSVVQTLASDPSKEAKPPENASNEPLQNKDISPALADDNWPALHEVKVTEVKGNSAAPVSQPGVAPPTPSGTASSPAVNNSDIQPPGEGSSISKPVDSGQAQAQLQNDSGGDDSSKENKESSTNGDESNNAVKSKKGSKPKWQRMEIDHPKPDRRNRRSRSQGRRYSPTRRDGRRPGDRFSNKPDSRRTDGPESQNWRENMLPQLSTTTTSATTTTNAVESGRGAFTGGRGARGRGGSRGNVRGGRGGGGRGRGGARDTMSPPFQPNPNNWSPDQAFPNIPADPETVQVMLGMDPNMYLHDALLNILGQASMFYEPSPNTYPPETLKHQVEYYFSEDNLVKDLFLRKKMDKQGWVKLELVLSFNKVKELKADHKSLIQAIKTSDKLELSEHEDYVRTVNSPEMWPIEDDFKGMPPPPAVQRVAAMSTLHSDAPEFVPGQPFVLRTLASDAPEFTPASQKEERNTSESGLRWTQADEEEDNLLCDATSNLTTIPPILSSRY